MEKPKKKIVKHYDYNECAKYIAYKLGIKNLRDCAGKYSENKPDAPYQDFWHVVMDQNDNVSNGSYVWILDDWYDCPEWAKPIADAFAEEFGKDEQFWVEW